MTVTLHAPVDTRRALDLARSLYGAPKLMPGQGSLLDGWPA